MRSWIIAAMLARPPFVAALLAAFGGGCGTRNPAPAGAAVEVPATGSEAGETVEAATEAVQPAPAPGGEPRTAPVERLRAAQEAFAAGRWVEAERGFRESLGAWPAADEAIRFRAMEAALRAGDLEAALRDADAIATAGGRRAGRAAFVAGEIALAQERWLDARRIFAALDAERTYSTGRVPRSLDVADVLFGLARALEGAGEAVEARRAFERLVRWYPESPRAAEAEARLRAADPSFEISPHWRLDRAREMVKHRDWAEAIDELDRIPAGAPGIPREEVAFERAMALYKHRRRYAEAARAFEAVVAMRGPHEEDAAFHRARSLARSHRDDDAIAAYREFARRYPRGRRASKALYLASSLELYLGRFDAAITSLEALVGRNRTGPGLDDARWALALAYMLADRPADALPLIDGAEDDSRGALVRGRALYWGAVARIALGRETEAVERFEAAIRDYPLHYYALLARNRLEAIGRTPPHAC